MSEELTKDAIDLSTLSIPRLFGRYFLPTLLGMFSISAMCAIDGVFVGHAVGADGIAAINICVPILMLVTGLGLMMGAGCSVVASIHLAQHKLKAARINVTQSWIFASLVILAVIVPVLAFPSAVGRMLGSSEALLPLVREYMLGFMPGELFGVWQALLLFVIRLDGNPRLAMWCNVVSALANIVLDWFMIVYMDWGLMGAAVASTLSMMIGGVIAAWYMFFGARRLRPIKLKWSRRSLLYSIRNIGYQCTIGSSALMGEGTMAVLALVGNYVFGAYLGDAGLGAFGIACYYTPFVYMIGNAVAQSAQPIISFNYGCGDSGRVRSTLRMALFTAMACGAVVSGAFALFPKQLVSMFVVDTEAAFPIAVKGFPIIASSFVFFIVNLTFIGYFQSVERVRPATVFSLLRGMILLVPSFIVLPMMFGDNGIWIALAVSELLTTMAIVGYLAYDFVHQSYNRA